MQGYLLDNLTSLLDNMTTPTIHFAHSLFYKDFVSVMETNADIVNCMFMLTSQCIMGLVFRK